MSYKMTKEEFDIDEQVVVDVTISRTDEDEESLAVFEQPVNA